VNCTQIPTFASAAGACAYIPPVPGTYEFRVFADSTFFRIGVSSPVTVTRAPPASFSASPTSISPGGSTTVSWSGLANATASDWIGLYTANTADASYVDWQYIDCSKTLGAAPSGGACTFSIPLVPGTYDLRLFASGSFTRLASTTVNEPAVGPTAFSAAPTTLPAGATATINWTSIRTPSATDWIGLYPVGAADSAFVDWKYVSCTRTPASAIATGSCAFTMPATSGNYEFRLFSNNTMTRFATSGAVTVVQQHLTTFSASPSTVPAGGSLTVSWTGISPATARDWIALYPSSSTADTDISTWMFVSCSTTANVAVPSGSCPITAPTKPGTYELRIFGNDSFTRMAVFDFTVGPPTVTSFSATPASVIAGQSVTVSWSGISLPSTTDWIAVYPNSSTTAGGYLNWMYASSCSQNVGANAVPTGSCQFAMPSAPGTTYEVRLYSSNTQAQIGAAAGPISITAAPATTLTASPSVVKPGASATVAWSNIKSPNATDWIGLYASSSAADSDIVSWEFVSCARTAGSSGAASGQCGFQVPQSMGAMYEFRLFAANGFTLLAKSNAFAIRPILTTLTAPATVRSGATFQVSWSGLDPASKTDWVGLYPAGAADQGGLQTWKYLSSCSTTPGASGAASGSCSFTAPGPGNYELRVFAADGFTKLGTVAVAAN
jgi:hypothetical protein